MTKEQREKINRIKYKRVVKNADNRKTLTEMYMQSKLYNIEYYIAQLMQGQMAQTSMLNKSINNLMVEAENIKKKAVKIAKEGDVNEQIQSNS
jgi:hypothetical protein